jgi:hypothetical protein
MINWKGRGRKRLLPNLRHYHEIYLQGLRETTKNINQYMLSPSRDLNPVPHEYEAGVLKTRPRRSSQHILIGHV